MRFNDGSAMRLYRQTIEDFGLYPGLVLAPEDANRLKEAADAMSAKMRAVRIVAASSVSKKDLEQRLVAKGENPEQARKAVKWMSDLDLVDDRKVAQQLVERCIHKGYGLERAKQLLYEKRIPKEHWSEVLDGYPNQFHAILQYLREHLNAASEQKEKKRVVESLLRKGHHYSVIKRAMDELMYDTDDIPED